MVTVARPGPIYSVIIVTPTDNLLSAHSENYCARDPDVVSTWLDTQGLIPNECVPAEVTWVSCIRSRPTLSAGYHNPFLMRDSAGSADCSGCRRDVDVPSGGVNSAETGHGAIDEALVAKGDVEASPFHPGGTAQGRG